MISQLLNPGSIAVVGASQNETKPGGKVIRNLINGGFKGELFAVNPNVIDVSGVTWIRNVNELKKVDLAIIAIPAQQCLQAIEELIAIGTRAFIVYSAGFSEAGEEGLILEKKMVSLISEVHGTLIGPNCIGIINECYKGVFTSPIPAYYSSGCELVSSSGATAVFIMESALQTGLKFSSIYSIGNAAQMGIEEILEHMDNTYVPHFSSPVKLLYLEHIKNPFKFIKHATSLVQKGCHIAAIKSGFSKEGSRAAFSHTGAMSTSDAVVRALFKKCGIVYCSSRDELVAVAGVLQSKALEGKKIAIITHAGGSAVLLTDALTTHGLQVPAFASEDTEELLSKLNQGSSVKNPIDFLATGTAEQLGLIIDFCESYERIDGMIVVFGSPGLFNVKDAYDVLAEKMRFCSKPIFPVLPSLVNAEYEIKSFLSNGWVNFPDEVNLGNALSHVVNSKKQDFQKMQLPQMDFAAIRAIINGATSGSLSQNAIKELFDAVGVELAKSVVVSSKEQVLLSIQSIPFPVVLKVEGPVHKTEVKGVKLNISSEKSLIQAYEELMKIPQATGVMVQEMISGQELYCGSVHEGDFGHLVIFGLGGVFLELLNDTVSGLAPLSKEEVGELLKKLKAYPLFLGYRNLEALDLNKFIDLITRIAALVHVAPEIKELDLNPIMATSFSMKAVDVRIRIDKNNGT